MPDHTVPSDIGLRVELLGPPRAWHGTEELDLGPARQRAVFAALALRANAVVSRRELIAAVWGDRAPQSAEGSVYTYVSGLRRNLGSLRQLLTSEGQGYSLRLPLDALDVTEFDRLRAVPALSPSAAEAGLELDAPLPSPAEREVLASLDAALARWHGEPLSGVPGPLAEAERERLNRAKLETLERRAAAVLATGGHVDLAAELTVLVREHPLRESLREYLMIALYRSGRHAEALEAFRDARRALVEELGVEPGKALRRRHEQILAAGPGDPGAPAEKPLLSVLPAGVASTLRDGAHGSFVGRERERTLLRDAVSDVLAGRGRVVWIEGEAGIGKSELLKEALADAQARGSQLGWAAADELAPHVPLRLVQSCLGIDHDQGSEPSSRWHDTVALGADRLLAHVDELCARAPVTLVLDDIQWADEASVLVWHRLCAAARQLPLLLVAAARPVPGRAELDQLRRSVANRGGEVLVLEPITAADAEQLVTTLVGARAGDSLRELAMRAAGNPLYLIEIVDALVRSGAVRTSAGVADIAGEDTADAPDSLISAIARRLDGLVEGARDVVRHAAVLGTEFSVADLAAVTGKRMPALVSAFEDAVAAKVVVDAGSRFAFRHPLLRQAVYEGIPGPERARLHRATAEAIAAAGAAPWRVAEQLVAAPIDGWARRWLAGHTQVVSNRAPLVAADLLERAVAGCAPGEEHYDVLLWALVKIQFRLDRVPEELAQRALETIGDAYRRSEMRQLLAAMQYRLGRNDEGIATIGTADDDPDVPEIWRVRHKHLLANFRRGDLSDLDAAEAAARRARELADGEPYSVAHALQTRWLLDSIRRRHDSALVHIDEAIAIIGDHAEFADLRVDLLDNRMFTLQNLDRLRDAEKTLHEAHDVAARFSLPDGLQVPTAVHHYWDGGWDESLAELDTVTEDGPAITFFGLREVGPGTLLMHGVAALIAGRRNDRGEAAGHLDAAEAHAPVTGAERESVDFLLAAQALAAEQRGEPERALELFAPILNPTYAAMMLRHQWLPGFTRLALDVGDRDRADQALAVCEEEAAKEAVPARAHAALLRCRALLTGEPGPAIEAAAHYADVGRVVEHAEALEDAAVLLARAGRTGEAEAALGESIGIFTELVAHWDIHRATERLRPFGVTAAQVASRPGAGWDSLSAVERRVTILVAQGRSNPDIAAELSLPRRTVQAHVARVLGKLDARARADLAEVLRKPV